MQIENNLNLQQYQQDEWVSIQCYHKREWQDLIILWKAYNEQLLNILKNIDDSKLSITAIFPESGSKSLQWIIDDYIRQIEHPLHFHYFFTEILSPIINLLDVFGHLRGADFNCVYSFYRPPIP